MTADQTMIFPDFSVNAGTKLRVNGITENEVFGIRFVSPPVTTTNTWAGPLSAGIHTIETVVSDPTNPTKEYFFNGVGTTRGGINTIIIE